MLSRQRTKIARCSCINSWGVFNQSSQIYSKSLHGVYWSNNAFTPQISQSQRRASLKAFSPILQVSYYTNRKSIDKSLEDQDTIKSKNDIPKQEDSKRNSSEQTMEELNDITNSNNILQKIVENGNREGFPFNILPTFTHPYIELGRYHRPIGTWLLLYPTLWSAGLANLVYGTTIVPIELFFLFSIGALVMRGAGCTINDFWDKNLDKHVERTKLRPLASGELSPAQGLRFMIYQSLIGALVLFQMTPHTIMTGIASLGFVATYPLMKRVTFWPQMFLGVTFNWGVWVGWSAVVGSFCLPVLLPMYTACIAWTLIYDTIYAHQDKADDVKVGVKSTALLFGENTQSILTGFLMIFLIGMTLTGYNLYQLILERKETSKIAANVSPSNTQIPTSNSNPTILSNSLYILSPYFAAVAFSCLHLSHQIHFTDYNNYAQCSKAFLSNRWIGLAFVIGIACSTYLHNKAKDA